MDSKDKNGTPTPNQEAEGTTATLVEVGSDSEDTPGEEEEEVVTADEGEVEEVERILEEAALEEKEGEVPASSRYLLVLWSDHRSHIQDRHLELNFLFICDVVAQDVPKVEKNPEEAKAAKARGNEFYKKGPRHAHSHNTTHTTHTDTYTNTTHTPTK